MAEFKKYIFYNPIDSRLRDGEKKSGKTVRSILIERAKMQTQPIDSPSSVILKTETLDANKITPFNGQKPSNGLFEPQTFYEYIGQEDAKEQIKTAIKIIKTLRPVHILINGWAGCGKTALARIAANMMNARFIYRVPEQLEDVDKLLEVINLIQNSDALTVLMLDEIHTLCKFPRVANVLLPILQDFKYGDVSIRPFVMIGATTDLDMLMKRQSPLVSRFHVKVTLDKYFPQELKTIIKNYKNALYKELPVNEEDYDVIANNSRGIPREAIALLLKQLVTQDMKKVLKQSRIIKDGLTHTDIRILKTLTLNEKPMGANYLSQAASIPQADYEEIYERYLVEEGLVCRQTRGRTITPKGRNFLHSIETGKAGSYGRDYQI
jgi:Holliday junction DNA helicase RuvB